jgi:hypothetical protein
MNIPAINVKSRLAPDFALMFYLFFIYHTADPTAEPTLFNPDDMDEPIPPSVDDNDDPMPCNGFTIVF